MHLTHDGASGGGSTIITPSNQDNLGGGGVLGTVLLASLLGRNGLNGGYGNVSDPILANQIADARRDITKSEGDVKEAFNSGLHRNQIENAAHFTNLLNRSCEVEKEAMRTGHAAEIRALETKADLLANQNANTISIKDDIKDFRFDVSNKFCELNHNLDNKFCRLDHELDRRFACVDKQFDNLREGELKRENRELREKIDSIRYKEESKDINAIKRDVDTILCGLRNIPAPTNQVRSVVADCGC